MIALRDDRSGRPSFRRMDVQPDRNRPSAPPASAGYPADHIANLVVVAGHSGERGPAARLSIVCRHRHACLPQLTSSSPRSGDERPLPGSANAHCPPLWAIHRGTVNAHSSHVQSLPATTSSPGRRGQRACRTSGGTSTGLSGTLISLRSRYPHPATHDFGVGGALWVDALNQVERRRQKQNVYEASSPFYAIFRLSVVSSSTGKSQCCNRTTVCLLWCALHVEPVVEIQTILERNLIAGAHVCNSCARSVSPVRSLPVSRSRRAGPLLALLPTSHRLRR